MMQKTQLLKYCEDMEYIYISGVFIFKFTYSNTGEGVGWFPYYIIAQNVNFKTSSESYIHSDLAIAKGLPYWILKWKLAENFLIVAHFYVKGVPVSRFIKLNEDWNSKKKALITDFWILSRLKLLKKMCGIPSCLCEWKGRGCDIFNLQWTKLIHRSCTHPGLFCWSCIRRTETVFFLF